MSTKLFERSDRPTQSTFIDNKYAEGTGTPLELVNPKDGTTIQTMSDASPSDVDRATTAAKLAFETGPWATFTGAQRARCLNKLADLIDDHAEELAYLESLCSGRPYSSILRGDMPRVAAVFRYYAGWADKISGESYPPEDGFYKIVEKKPLGVCGAIIAWNGSFHFLSWKAAPALACGNTVVLKPSEKSPLGCLAFGHLIQAANFPPGVFNIIAGGREAGATMASSMDIAKISFTGSTATGKAIQIAATKSNLKAVTLELGGKSPGIVFEDAKLETAIFWSIIGITSNTGQVCAATSRVFVHESIAEAFIDGMSAAFQKITENLGGDPQDPATTYGPLVDKEQYDKVHGFIAEARESGRVLSSHPKAPGKGYYVAPHIIKDPDVGSRAYTEEIFGPVLCIKTFKTEQEAIQLANDSKYGLAGSVYTRDIGRALRVGGKIEGGTIGINCSTMVGPQVPMGGFKTSGSGRELGEYALRHYTDTRTLWINMNG